MKEWVQPDGEAPGLMFKAAELAGEVGELCNELKKVERSRLGMVGGLDIGHPGVRRSIEDEIADVVICADLIALELGISLSVIIPRKFNNTSKKNGLQTLLSF